MSKHRTTVMLLLVLLATTGCYTQLRQVPAASLPSGEPPDWESWYAPPGFSFYDTWTLPYYTAYYGPVPWSWAPYYYYPWWWRPGGPPPWSPGPSSPVETGGRHAWDRGPGAPYIPGIGGTQQPIPPAGGNPATKPPDSKPSTEPGKPDDRKPEDRKPDDRKPDQKRHGWGR